MKNIIAHIFKKKHILFVVITTIIFGMLGTAYNLLILNRQMSMVIEFNYPGAEKGLNPDGSVFDVSELKSPEVIEKAKEHLDDKSLDTEFLRSRILVTTKLSDNSVDKVISAVQSEKNIIYMPTAFYIYYSQKDKFSKNESRLFMESLAKAYSDFFNEKYSEKNDILSFVASEHDFENIDYIEIHRILKNKVDSMLNYIKAHQNEDRAFYSEDNKSLGMAAKKLESFRDTSLEKFYSYIIQNGLSKNSKEYVESLDYFINDNKIAYEKAIEGSEMIKDSVSKYNQDSVVVFVPSVDANRNYYMSRTKTGVDFLTQQSYTMGIGAAKTLKEIEYYESIKKKFENKPPLSDEKKETVETMIKNLAIDLEQISKDILKTDNEYLSHKTMNYFVVRLPQQNYIRLGFIIKVMILGFMLAFAVVLFIEFLKKRLMKRVKTIEDAFSAVNIVKENRGE